MKNRILLVALLIATSSAFAQVPSYVPTNGLVAWWPFNGNANDESGNGNNGTVNGATLTSDRFGNISNALNFNGTSNYVTTNLNSINNQFAPNAEITSIVWIKTSDLNGPLISFQGAGGYEYDFHIGTLCDVVQNTGHYGILIRDVCCGTGNNIFGGIVSDNSWHMLTIIRKSNGSILCYKDGLYEGTSPAGNNNSLIFTIPYLSFGADRSWVVAGPGCGACNSNDQQHYSGVLDDIGIWNRALTQQEITTLYNAQTCNSTSNTIIADGPTTFCAGNYVNLTSDVVGGTYQWKKNGVNITTNATSRTYKATSSGSYNCVATCNGTAITSNAIQVTSKTNASVSVTASGATSFCAGDSVTLNCTNLGSNYSVQWYRTNVSMENATNYSIVVKQPGTYKVVTKNLTTGCSRISGSSAVVAVNCRLANPDVIAADITESDFDAATREAEPKGKIYIYPNPTSDNKFTVELMGLEVDGNATLEVYNAMGQILFSEKVNITNGTLNRTIQIDEQSKGQLCLVRLIAGSEVYDSKVILK